MSRSTLIAQWLGRIPYTEGLALQERRVDARRRGTSGDTLVLLEHPAVITLGRGSHREHLLATPQELERRGVEVHECGRGGDITYHGPGQLVGYPILALGPGERDAHRYLRHLEEVLIRVLADFDIAGRRAPGLTGVWVGQGQQATEAKIAAIGVRLSTGWITSHGFALNVTTDLSSYDAIVPCGIRGRGVTSMEALLRGRPPSLADVTDAVARRFAEVFDRRLEPCRSGGRPGPALSCLSEERGLEPA